MGWPPWPPLTGATCPSLRRLEYCPRPFRAHTRFSTVQNIASHGCGQASVVDTSYAQPQGKETAAGKRKSRPLAWRQGGEFPRIQADARGHSPRPALNRNGVNGDRSRHSDGIPKPNTRSRKRTALLPGEGAGAEYVGAMMCRDCPSSTGARCARPGSRSRDKKAPDDAQGLVLSRLDENECADCCCSSCARTDKMMPILPGQGQGANLHLDCDTADVRDEKDQDFRP